MPSTLLKKTDQCVRCGLCLPHCPTYQQAQQEPESPRGRIQMLAALARNEIAWSESLQTHLDHCLACGHCERVCPAEVAYESILLEGRALLAQKKKLSWLKRMALTSIETPWLRQILFLMIRCLQKLPLSRILPKPFKRAWNYFPRPQTTYQRFLPKKKQCQDTVLLFLGCTGSTVAKNTAARATQLLEHCGFKVAFLPKDVCCKALSAHAGALPSPAHSVGEGAQRADEGSISSFCKKNHIQSIITFATGCGAFLKRTAFEAPLTLYDIQEFLLIHAPEIHFDFAKNHLPFKRIAVHSPCTQTNALGQADLSLRLLEKIPDITLHPFGATTCCGAAGSYMLEEPVYSDAFIAALLTPELLATCDAIVTSNIGCQLHMVHYLKQQGRVLPVLHPIELLF